MPYIGRDTDKLSNVEVLDTITFDGSQSYTLQKNSANFVPSSANNLLISIDGVVQAGNFTVSGSTIDFGVAVASSSTCDFILHYGVGLITTPADGTITDAKLAASAINSQTAETSIAGGDEVLIYDTSASALRKMTRTNFVSGVGGDNKPIFYGELASSQTVTRSTDTKVTGMTNNEVDSNTTFDGTTFTVPSGQGGTYYLKGIVTGDFATAGQDGEEVRAYIYKNGSSIKEARIFKNTGGANYADLRRVTVIAETIVSLSASDTVELYARMTDFNGSGDGDVVSGQSSLGGYKLIT